MPNHPWLETLPRDLLRQGLPADYIARFVQELDDHIEDLFLEQEAIMQTEVQGTNSGVVGVLEQRLGSREQLTERAVAEYRKGSFSSRHPVLMFLIASIPAVIICWALYFPLACLIPEGLGIALGYGLGLIHKPVAEWPQAFLWTVRHLHLNSAFVPPLIVVLFWCRLFRRSGRTRRWGLASCLVIALIAGLYVTRLEPPTVNTKGYLQVGLGLTTSPSLGQITQFLLPLTLGSYLVMRENRAVRSLSPKTGE